MATLNIRKKVQDYIENADERILKMVYVLLREYENVEYSKSVLTIEQQEEMDKRWQNHKNGRSQSYSVQEVKRHVQAHLKK